MGYLPLTQEFEGTGGLYIKRQQDFGYRMWRNPFNKWPTYFREYRNLLYCSKHGLPAVQPVAFAMRDHDGHRQAILITCALDKYFPLSERETVDKLGFSTRIKLVKEVANVVRQYHDAGMQHGCLYPKHIFINRDVVTDDAVRVRLIDLEKAEPISWWNGGIFRDIDSLNRRSYGWDAKDRLRFLARYLSLIHISEPTRRACRSRMPSSA